MDDSTQQHPTNTLKKAALAALSLHLLLAAVIPAIPTLEMSFTNQSVGGLNVLLEKAPEEPFEQSLNDVNSQADSDVSQASKLNTSSQTAGSDDSDENHSQEITGVHSDNTQSQAIGQNPVNKISPSIVYSYASILKFAKQEAIRYADKNPDEIAQFNRSFNSRKQYQKRKPANQYKNQYGDQYVKNGSSGGDICFVKKNDRIVRPSGTFDESTYTVHFFRCKDKDTIKF